MTDYLLDTGILIRYLRESPGYDKLLDELHLRSSLVISAYTRIEIIRSMGEREREVTLDLLNRMITMPVNIQNADLAGELIRGWREKGFVISGGDAIIAATGLNLDLELVTTNGRHFPMPELVVWQADEQGNIMRRPAPETNH
jgi:predicted nucleic acid-binding protein